MPYQILNWRTTYENNRSRAYKNCKFVCVPNNQDKEGMIRILSDKDGVALYGIWCLMLGAASMHSERDGWLTSDGKQSGTPWTAEYMALRWRTDKEKVVRLLAILSSESVGWIKAQESRSKLLDSCGEIAFGAQTPGTVQAIEQELEQEQEQELEQEENKKADAAVKRDRFKDDAQAIFAYWSERFGKTGYTFTAKSRRYKKVVARLRDGKTIEDIKLAVDGCYSDEWWRTVGNHDLAKICESIDSVESFASKMLDGGKDDKKDDRWTIAAKELIALRESMEVKSKIGTASSDAQQICSRIGREKLEAMDMATVRSVVYQVSDKLAGK